MIPRLLAVLLLSLSLVGFAQAADIRGHYELVGEAPAAHSVQKVRFEEFLNFGCPHCNNLRNLSQDFRKKYAEQIEFIDIPIAFRGQDDAPLRLYHIAKKQGKGDLVKTALFDASFKHSVNVFDPGIVNYLARSLGMGPQYKEQKDQAWVTALIEEGMQKATAYGVTGTPTVVLENSMKMDVGQYGDMAAFVEKLPETIDDLLAE